MNGPISYDECNCFALRQAARYVTQIYERHLGEVGLTAAQFTILAKLARTPEATMIEIADAMVMDRTTLVRALKPLQRDGFVVSEASEHDGRTYLLSLSESGKETFAQAAVAWRNAQAEFEGKFGQGRAKALRAELFGLTADAG
ncbi:MarR family transcriptional regulator [Paraburkholderia sp.]|jgi:DNA-binding MarR family transcriptional regulator|uniref:MarR family winged helix-turn-helix transcriptional regulator n=1 Tax=Paraburkholderia sp. TaxID=1926495 RepID=UPI002F4144C6